MLTESSFDLGTAALDGEFRAVRHPQLTVSAQRVAGRFKLTLGTIHPLPETIPEAKGYSVKRIESSSRQLQYVSFTTRSEEMNGVFVVVMSEALERSAAAPDAEQSLSIFLNVLDEFRRLTQRRRGALSEEELRGLVAELLIFQNLLKAGISPLAAATAWSGPFGAAFDFIFSAQSALEVKSIHIGAKTISISSPEQLDVDIDDLRLAVVPLEETSDESQGSLTVAELITEIRSGLESEFSALEQFDEALIAARLDPHEPSVAGYRFSSTEPNFYHVSESFPSIRRSAIPEGVADVTYSLSLQALSAFEVPIPSTQDGSAAEEAENAG